MPNEPQSPKSRPISAPTEAASQRSAERDQTPPPGTYRWAPPRPSRAQKAIPKRGRNHFSVFMVIDDEDGGPGVMSGCGSLQEYQSRLLFLAEPDTLDVIEQVGPVPYMKNGRAHGHYLDQLVVKRDGRRLAFSDKPYAHVTPEFENELKQVQDAGVARGLFNQLYLLTEYGRDPVALHNATLIRGCRDRDAEADARAAEVVAAMTGPMQLRALAGQIGLGPRGFRALVRLIKPGRLRTVNHERIGLDTIVERGPEAGS